MMPGELHHLLIAPELHEAPLYRSDLIGDRKLILRDRLLGRWRADDYGEGGHEPVYAYDLEFNDDGTFTYSRTWLNVMDQRTRTSSGTWSMADGQLIQHWWRTDGKGMRTTVATVVRTLPREIVLDNTFSRASTFYRQPRLARQPR
jgi:hypothetical protein